MTNYGSKKSRLFFRDGFTIVEMLVVIVVIGILVSITVVSYGSITDKAITENIKADLGSASTQLMRYHADNGKYPTSVDDCPNNNTAMICVERSTGNTYLYVSDGKTYTLTATGTNNKSYYITNISSTPIATGPVTTYTLTISTGTGGTVNAGGTYASGSTQTITATASGGYTFSSWTGSTGCSGAFSHTITMNENKTCTASFTVADPNWIAGIPATALEGKWVYYQDLALSSWGPSGTLCPTGTGGSQPCQVGIDPNYAAYSSLISPQSYPAMDFSAYPAQNSCDAIGGRLGTMTEVLAIYNGMASYGNNFNLVNKPYWSTIENNSTTAGTIVFFSSGAAMTFGKTNLYSVRCIKD